MATRAEFARGASLRALGAINGGASLSKPLASSKDTSASAVSVPLPLNDTLTIDVATALINRVSADDEASNASKSVRSLAATSALARLSTRHPGSIHTASSAQALQFRPKSVIPFPKVITQDIKAAIRAADATMGPTGAGVDAALPVTVCAGILPEIHRVYFAVQSRLYLWDYTRGGGVYLYPGADPADPVVAVTLMTPPACEAYESIRSYLVVAYRSKVTLLGVRFDSPVTAAAAASAAAAAGLSGPASGGFTAGVTLPAPSTLGDIALLDTGLTVSTGGVAVTSLQGTDCGRLFYGASDGCLYEFVSEPYAHASGVASVLSTAASLLCGGARRRPVCYTINHTLRSAAAAAVAGVSTGGVVSRLSGLLFGAPRGSSVAGLCFDSSRRTHLLTVLFTSGALQLWFAGGSSASGSTSSGSVHYSCGISPQQYLSQVRARVGGAAVAPAVGMGDPASVTDTGFSLEYQPVALAAVPADANPDVHVVVTTSAGHRVFLAFTVTPPTAVFGSEQRALTVAYVRPAAVTPAPAVLAAAAAAAAAGSSAAGARLLAAAHAAAAATSSAPEPALAPRAVYRAYTATGGETILAMSGFAFPPRAPASAVATAATAAAASATGEYEDDASAAAGATTVVPSINLVGAAASVPAAAADGDAASTTLMLLSPDLPTDARGLISVTAAADLVTPAGAAAAAPGAAAAVSAAAGSLASPIALHETAEYVNLGPQVHALAEVPPSYYLSSPGRFLYASSQTVPLAGLHTLATQHAVPARQFIALTGRGLQFFVKDRPVDAVAAALGQAMALSAQRARQQQQAAAAVAAPGTALVDVASASVSSSAATLVTPASPAAIAGALTALMGEYDASELGAMLLTVACQPRRVAAAAAAAAVSGLLPGDAAASSAAAAAAAAASVAAVRIPSAADAAALERTAAIAFLNLNTVAVTAGAPAAVRVSPRTMALVRQVSRLLRPVWNWELVVQLTSNKAAAAAAATISSSAARSSAGPTAGSASAPGGFIGALLNGDAGGPSAGSAGSGSDGAYLAAGALSAASGAVALGSARASDDEDSMLRLRYRAGQLEAIRAPLVTLAQFIDLNWPRLASLDIAALAPFMTPQLPAGVDAAAVVAAVVNGATAAAPTFRAGSSAATASSGGASGGFTGGAPDALAAFYGGSLPSAAPASESNSLFAAGAGAASSSAAASISHQMQQQQHQHALALLIELCRGQAQCELDLLVQLRSTLRTAIQALTVTLAFAKAAVGLPNANPALMTAALGRATRYARAANAAASSLAWDWAFDRLPDRLCKQLTALRFRDLVTTTHGRGTLRQLAWRVAVMVQADGLKAGLSLAPCLEAAVSAGSTAVVDFEDMLARECPAFFPDVDHSMIKAQRLVTLASQPAVPTTSLDTPAVAAAVAALGAADMPVRNAERARLVDAAVALFTKVCASEECDVRVIVDILCTGRFYEAASKVLVARADMLSRLSASPRGMLRRDGACFVPAELLSPLATVETQQQWLQRANRDVQTSVQGIVEELLAGPTPVPAAAAAAAAAGGSSASPATVAAAAVAASARARAGEGQLTAEQFQLHYSASMHVLLRSTIRLVHDAVYSFLLAEASGENSYHQALLVIKHPALEEFLWRQGELDLLKDYFVGHGMHEKAVGLLVKLALDVPADDVVAEWAQDEDPWERELAAELEEEEEELGARSKRRRSARRGRDGSDDDADDDDDESGDGSDDDDSSDTASSSSGGASLSPRRGASNAGSTRPRSHRGPSSGAKSDQQPNADVTGAGVYYDDTDNVAPAGGSADAGGSARQQAAARARARLNAALARQRSHAGLRGPRARVYTLPERQGFLAKALSCAQMAVMRLQTAGPPGADAAAAPAGGMGGAAIKAESLGDLILQLRERLEVARLQAAVLSRVEAAAAAVRGRLSSARWRDDSDSGSAAAAAGEPSFLGRSGALEDTARRALGELGLLRSARRQLQTRLMSMDPDLYRVAADCGLWDVCLQIFHRSREDRYVEHVEQLWVNVIRGEIAQAQETGADWEEPTAQKIVSLLQMFAKTDALCPVQFLIQTLERLRFDYGRPDPALRGFVVDTFVAANVSLDTLCLSYADLLEAQTQQAPLAEVVLLTWSAVTVLRHLLTVIQREGEAAPASQRAAHLRGLASSLLQACPVAKLKTSAGARALLEQVANVERTLAIL
jgi:hypothetical protein